MLKFLLPQVSWNNIQAVGFDLDGTLYDEFEFIVQVYRPIAECLALVCHVDTGDIYNRILCRWLEKGSSYNRIFDEVLSDYEIHEDCKKSTVSACLSIYRNFEPRLVLSERMSILLTYCSKRYEMFIVTDGAENLQKKKFEALGLGYWFQDKNVLVSGTYGPNFQKPSISILRELKLAQEIEPSKIIFFGDREIDQKFANNAGFDFVKLRYFAINHRE